MSKSHIVVAALLAGALTLLPVTAYPQDTSTPSVSPSATASGLNPMSTATAAATDSSGVVNETTTSSEGIGQWGWLGILGLFGLFGLRKPKSTLLQ